MTVTYLVGSTPAASESTDDGAIIVYLQPAPLYES
jgi:hypothetical protein